MTERTKKYLIRAMAIFIAAVFIIPATLTMIVYFMA